MPARWKERSVKRDRYMYGVPAAMSSAFSASLPCFWGFLHGSLPRLIHERDRAAQVRDDDRTADSERHAENVEELLFVYPFLPALQDVVRDAVVAPEHHGGDEPQHLLRLRIERS